MRHRIIRPLSLLAALALGATLARPAGASFVVGTTADTPDADPGDGICADADGNVSLRAAIQEANARGVAEIIELEPRAVYVLSIAGDGEDDAATGDLDVLVPIVIRGNGATLDAGGLDRAFDVTAAGSLRVEDLHVIGGTVSEGDGGAFRSAGTLVLHRASVSASVASAPGALGGAVFNDGGMLRVRETSFDGNSAAGSGGAVASTGGETAIAASTFTGNHAGGHSPVQGGGAIFLDGGQATLHGNLLQGNVADGNSGAGGAVLALDAVLEMTRGLVIGNAATRAGGGVALEGGAAFLRAARLAANESLDGGGLHIAGDARAHLEASVVLDNLASGGGGGAWNGPDGTLTVSRSTIRGNSAAGEALGQGGGGIFNHAGGMVIEDSMILDNTAPGADGAGGGIYNNGGVLDMYDTRIAFNQSNRAGGGIEVKGGVTYLEFVSLLRNETGDHPGHGGGLHVSGSGLVFLIDGFVAGNDAAGEGGGIWNSDLGDITVESTLFNLNSAPVGPDVHNDGGKFTIDGFDVPVGP